MDFHMKLPRNGKEGVLFTLIISFISLNIIAPIITCFEAGFSLQNWGNFYKSAPLLFVVILACVIITRKPAELLRSVVSKEGDSFRSVVVLEAVCTVVFMSMLMSIFGSWIGMREISWHPFQVYFYKWPRNYGIALFVEVIIAQPIARFIMLKMHEAKDKKAVQA